MNIVEGSARDLYVFVWKGGETAAGAKLHPNREAPRCLPCGYKDPAMMAGDMCPGMTGFMPVQVISVPYTLQRKVSLPTLSVPHSRC